MGSLLAFSNLTIFMILAYLVVFVILTVISMLYAIFWIVILKKDNSFTKLRELAIYLAAGFATAMLQITLMTLLRNTLL
jgi:hypothetical protein